ncbi:MAG: DUF1549 domain-containing protein [Pirellulaceae bacterium]|nr:DUF1549 domain-containing protein [Pirellulaceae bacterium]
MPCRLIFALLVFAAPAAGWLAYPASAAQPGVVSFELDVMPILTARGCNQGACHGKARGQNGFQLSLLGFDPDFDFAALTQQARGRRVFPASPDRSLLLVKGSAQVPHGGGLRLEAEGGDYATLRRWIEQGTPRRSANEPKLVSVAVLPTERFLRPGETVQLAVTATYSDGTHRDVTSLTQYQSSEAGLVAASPTGLVTAGTIAGEATIMSRYMNLIVTTNITIPLAGTVPDDVYAALPRANFIDDLVWAKLKTLAITPSPPADDAKFLRRVHLDLIGRLPTPDETRAFLADGDSHKRERLVDELLARPEYADHWAGKWADLLRPNPYRVGVKAVMNYDAWIRESFRQNKPYDQFVRELVTAQGSTWENGAAVLFRDRREPVEITTLVSQLFLGIRLECAKCHHHPFEKWGQDDFYSFAAWFGQMGFKGTGLSPPISGGEEIILAGGGRRKATVSHPLTGEAMSPRPLFGQAPPIAEGSDPREALAAWIAGEDNPFFAQTIANRLWADLMGRGLVEPIDDLRATNPPTNAALLAALAADLRGAKFDLKHLLRTICTSRVYALSSLPGERNIADRQNYSRHYRTRLRAEVLAGAVSDISGVPETFTAMPAGSRANEIWTTRVQSVFLDTFGRPNPNQDPPCERTTDTTVTQTLHLMNAPQLHSRVTADAGQAARLAASDRSPDQIVEEIYLLVYCRFPDDAERDIGRRLFAEPEMTRRRATEDLLWALLNTPEFIFKD